MAPSPWGESFLAVVSVAVLYAVLEILFVAHHGQTPAMDLLNIRVEAIDGRAPSLASATVRWLVPGLAMALPPPATAVVLALLSVPAIWDSRRRSVADRMAGLCMVMTDWRHPAHSGHRPPGLILMSMEKHIAGVTGNSADLPRRDASTSRHRPSPDDPTHETTTERTP